MCFDPNSISKGLQSCIRTRSWSVTSTGIRQQWARQSSQSPLRYSRHVLGLSGSTTCHPCSIGFLFSTLCCLMCVYLQCVFVFQAHVLGSTSCCRPPTGINLNLNECNMVMVRLVFCITFLQLADDIDIFFKRLVV